MSEEEQSFSFVDKRRMRPDDEESSESAVPAPEEPSAVVDEELSAPAPAETVPDSAGAEAPPIDFVTFILSLSSSAAYHMGGFQDPVSGKTSVNLDLAKQTIDIIAMLEEKTRGNLTEDEGKLISHALYDLRMQFVEASKAPQAG